MFRAGTMVAVAKKRDSKRKSGGTAKHTESPESGTRGREKKGPMGGCGRSRQERRNLKNRAIYTKGEKNWGLKPGLRSSTKVGKPA